MDDFNKRNIKYVLAGNKADTVTGINIADKFSGIDSLFISARRNKGITELKEKLYPRILSIVYFCC